MHVVKARTLEAKTKDKARILEAKAKAKAKVKAKDVIFYPRGQGLSSRTTSLIWELLKQASKLKECQPFEAID
jgi:hypothetical protein